MVRRIVLDTNFLMLPGQYGLDIISEIKRLCDFRYELVVLKESLLELDSIIESSKSKGADKKAAKLAKTLVLQLKKGKDLKIASLNHSKYVDDLLVSLAREQAIIATADSELKKRIKALKDYTIITPRNKKYLIFEGGKDVLQG